MTNPRRRESRYFVPPSDAWHFDESDAEPPPRFARLCPRDHRRRIGDSAMRLAHLTDAGLRVWKSPDMALDRLGKLASLLSNGDVAEGDLASFRRALEAAWSDTAQLHPIDAGKSRGYGRDRVCSPHPRDLPSPNHGDAGVLYVPDAEVASLTGSSMPRGCHCSSRRGTALASLLLLKDAKSLMVRPTSEVDASVVADSRSVRLHRP